MPRRRRLFLVDQPMHVVQRGNDRKPCFRGEPDYLRYLQLLDEFADGTQTHVHAYVLMPNHVHLLVTPRRAGACSHLMKAVGERYVRHFNRVHRRTGGLWDGRFYSSLVDTATYFLRCHRYIELNPVRANMVASASEYRWSSHRANAWGETVPWVTSHPEYLRLGLNDHERRFSYRALFREPLSEEDLKAFREAIRGGFAVGSKAFLERVQKELGMRARASRRQSGEVCPRRPPSWSDP